MFKSTSLAILSLAAALAALPAAAQSSLSGFYVGAGFGQSKANDWCALGGFDSCDDKDKAWKLFGGYQFNRNIAVEAGYTNLGKFDAAFTTFLGPDTEQAKVTAWEASAIGTLPIAGSLSLLGRLGVYRASVKDNDAIFGEFKHDNTNFTFGAGLGFDITPNLGVRAEWQRYYQVGGGDVALGAGVGEKSDVDVVGISALWRF